MKINKIPINRNILDVQLEQYPVDILSIGTNQTFDELKIFGDIILTGNLNRKIYLKALIYGKNNILIDVLENEIAGKNEISSFCMESKFFLQKFREDDKYLEITGIKLFIVE